MLSHTATHGLLWTVELPSEQRITLFDFPNESLSPAEILRRHVPQFFRNVSDRVASLGTRGAWWYRVREFLITWGQRLHAGRCVETTPCCHDCDPKMGPGSGSPGSPAPEVHVRSTNGTSISQLPAVFGICRKRYSRGWVELTFWGNGLQLQSSRFLLVETWSKPKHWHWKWIADDPGELCLGPSWVLIHSKTRQRGTGSKMAWSDWFWLNKMHPNHPTWW